MSPPVRVFVCLFICVHTCTFMIYAYLYIYANMREYMSYMNTYMDIMGARTRAHVPVHITNTHARKDTRTYTRDHFLDFVQTIDDDEDHKHEDTNLDCQVALQVSALKHFVMFESDGPLSSGISHELSGPS